MSSFNTITQSNTTGVNPISVEDGVKLIMKCMGMINQNYNVIHGVYRADMK